MMSVLLIMIGGTVGFFTAALCKAAGRADRDIEFLEQQENNLARMTFSESQQSEDVLEASLNKETIV